MLTGILLGRLIGPEHEPIITTGGQIIIALIGVGGTLLAAQLEAVRRSFNNTRSAIDAVGATAQQAADNAHPVSNGFSSSVRDSLHRIEAEQLASRADVGRLRDEVLALRDNDRQLWAFIANLTPDAPPPLKEKK